MGQEKSPAGLFSRLRRIWARHQAEQERKAALSKQLEQVIDIADPEIRRATGYRRQLIDHLGTVKTYCSAIIESIPGPVQLESDVYFDDPTVKALFVSPEHLQEVIQRSPESKELHKSGYHGQVVALMTMTMEEKTVFGQQQQGEMILRDVAERAVNFVDHKLVAPASDLPSAKRNLSEHGLEVLATFAMEKISSLRSQIAGLKEKQEYLKAAMKILSGKTSAHYRYTVPDRAMLEKLDKAEEGLREIEKKLADARRELSSPDDALRILSNIINEPEKVIAIHPQVLRLNWMNVEVDEASGEGHRIDLAEFNFPDNVKRSAIFVTFTI